MTELNMIIQYAIHNSNDLDDKHDRYDFEMAFFDAEFPDFVAAECAEHYYDNHDGWDTDLNGEVFRLFINDEVIGDFEIYSINFKMHGKATREAYYPCLLLDRGMHLEVR